MESGFFICRTWHFCKVSAIMLYAVRIWFPLKNMLFGTSHPSAIDQRRALRQYELDILLQLEKLTRGLSREFRRSSPQRWGYDGSIDLQRASAALYNYAMQWVSEVDVLSSKWSENKRGNIPNILFEFSAAKIIGKELNIIAPFQRSSHGGRVQRSAPVFTRSQEIQL